MFNKDAALKKTMAYSKKKTKRFIRELNREIKDHARFGIFYAANCLEHYLDQFNDYEKEVITKYYTNLGFTCHWVDSNFLIVDWIEK